jgi:hypothetical protein
MADDERFHHGPEAVQRFEGVMSRVLKVSKDELTKRETAYKKSRRARKSRRPHPAR